MRRFNWIEWVRGCNIWVDFGFSIHKGITGITNKPVRFNGIFSRIKIKTKKRGQFGLTSMN